MKKIFITSLFITTFYSFSFSQMSKDSLVKVMSKEMCTEISKQDFTGKKLDDFEAQLGMAMLPLFSKYSKQIKEVYGFEMDDQQGFEVIGRDIGMRLAVDCPAFLKLIMNDQEAVKEINDKVADKKTTKVSGILLKIVTGDITYFEVKTTAGKTEKVYWLEFFEGSDKLSTEMLNKKITVSYTEKEVYKSSLKDYSKIKIATSIKTE